MPASLLLVDPDVNFRRALSVGLQLEGFDVAQAAAADEARVALGRRRFGFVLVDALAGLDLVDELLRTGLGRPLMCSHFPELLRVARTRFPDVPVIEKPFSTAQLVGSLRDAA